jgi:hypothetical protein
VNGSTTCGGAVRVGNATVLGAVGDAELRDGEAGPAAEPPWPMWQALETDTADPAAKTATSIRNARPVSPVEGLGLPALMR